MGMKPETPDFDHIARQVVQRVVAELPYYASDALNDAIVDHLRQVWNARGAADISQVNAAYLTAPLDHVIDAIKAQDR